MENKQTQKKLGAYPYHKFGKKKANGGVGEPTMVMYSEENKVFRIQGHWEISFSYHSLSHLSLLIIIYLFIFAWLPLLIIRVGSAVYPNDLTIDMINGIL